MALFADHDLKWRQIENNSGYDEYNIGYWSHNTVNIISGTVKDVNNEAETADSIGFFVAYHVQVRDFVGIVMDPQLVGPIKGDEVDAFITKWMSDNGNRF
jgi:hypothetical protein